MATIADRLTQFLLPLPPLSHFLHNAPIHPISHFSLQTCIPPPTTLPSFPHPPPFHPVVFFHLYSPLLHNTHLSSLHILHRFLSSPADPVFSQNWSLTHVIYNTTIHTSHAQVCIATYNTNTTNLKHERYQRLTAA